MPFFGSIPVKATSERRSGRTSRQTAAPSRVPAASQDPYINRQQPSAAFSRAYPDAPRTSAPSYRRKPVLDPHSYSLPTGSAQPRKPDQATARSPRSSNARGQGEPATHVSAYEYGTDETKTRLYEIDRAVIQEAARPLHLLLTSEHPVKKLGEGQFGSVWSVFSTFIEPRGKRHALKIYCAPDKSGHIQYEHLKYASEVLAEYEKENPQALKVPSADGYYKSKRQQCHVILMEEMDNLVVR